MNDNEKVVLDKVIQGVSCLEKTRKCYFFFKLAYSLTVLARDTYTLNSLLNDDSEHYPEETLMSIVFEMASEEKNPSSIKVYMDCYDAIAKLK